MCAERERHNLRSSLQPISVSPAFRSVPAQWTPLPLRSTEFWDARKPVRFAQVDFRPALLRYALR